KSQRRAALEMQAAAVGRIDADGRSAHQTGVGAPLGDVAVDDVEPGFGRPACHVTECGHIAPPGVAAHGDAAEPEPETRFELGKHGFGPGPPRAASTVRPTSCPRASWPLARSTTC